MNNKLYTPLHNVFIMGIFGHSKINGILMHFNVYN